MEGGSIRACLLASALLAGAVPAAAVAPPVKLSNGGVCYGPGDDGYALTRTYTPYDSMPACLDAGGKAPTPELNAPPDAAEVARQITKSYNDDDPAEQHFWLGLGLVLAAGLAALGWRLRRARR